MKVLVVVEDDTDMRLLIKLTLAVDERLSVGEGCATAAGAVAEAGLTQPDLVILDHLIEGDVMGLQAAPSIKDVAPEASRSRAPRDARPSALIRPPGQAMAARERTACSRAKNRW